MVDNSESASAQLDLVWGGEGIAKAIHRPVITTFKMLERGELPAKKVGGRWVAERSKLIAFFMGDAA